jgi:hypothetical protein
MACGPKEEGAGEGGRRRTRVRRGDRLGDRGGAARFDPGA